MLFIIYYFVLFVPLSVIIIIPSPSVNGEIDHKSAHVTYSLTLLSRFISGMCYKKLLIIPSDFTLHGYYITVPFLLPSLDVRVTSILHKSLEMQSLYCESEKDE